MSDEDDLLDYDGGPVEGPADGGPLKDWEIALTAPQSLREQVFGTVAVWHGTLPLEHLQALVDAVLALPAIREVAEERDRLREQLREVEAELRELASAALRSGKH